MDVIKSLLSENRFLSNYKSAIITFTKLAIAAGLLIFIISYVEIDSIVKAVEQADVFLILLALALSGLNIYLQFYKWKLTAQKILGVSENSKILTSLFYGFSAAVFTPARIGEYFGRNLVFKEKSLVQVSVATLIDKFFPLYIVAFCGSISSVLFIYHKYQTSVYLILGLFIILFILFYFVSMLIFSERFWNDVFLARIKKSSRLNKYLHNLEAIESLDKKYSTKMFLVSLLFYSCFLIQYALLVSAFSHQNNFVDYLWAGNLLMFAKTVFPPISLGELGVREGASVFFITKIGLSSVIGFNASIFLFLINVLLPAIIGLVLLPKK